MRMAKLTGLAPSCPRQASQPRRITGTAQLSRTVILANRRDLHRRVAPPQKFARRSMPV